jgi:hypothetical protein
MPVVSIKHFKKDYTGLSTETILRVYASANETDTQVSLENNTKVSLLLSGWRQWPRYVQCQLISIMVMLKSRLLISIFAGSGMAG